MPKVSICVPVYNTEKYLRKCLDSLINQTLQDIEIIIVNDASPDNSQKIIDEYAEKDSRIVPICHPKNRGLSRSRETAVNVAKGGYIGFVDSDDWIDVTMYEKLYKKAEEESSDIVVCNNYLVYAKTGKIKYSYDFTKWKTKNKNLSDKEKVLSFNTDFAGHYLSFANSLWNKIWKYQLFETEDELFADLHGGEDVLTSLKLLYSKDNPTISIVRESLYYYCKYPNRPYNYTNSIKDRATWLYGIYEYLKRKKNKDGLIRHSRLAINLQARLLLSILKKNPPSLSLIVRSFEKSLIELQSVFFFNLIKLKVLLVLSQILIAGIYKKWVRVGVMIVLLIIDIKWVVKKVLHNNCKK